MKKNIAIIIDSLNGGGAERVCLTLAQALIAMGHAPHLIVLKNKCDYIVPSDIPVHFLVDDPLFRLHLKKSRQLLLNRFKNFLKKQNTFDLYIANLDESHHLLNNAKLPNCVYVVHNSIHQSLKRSMKLGPIKYFRKLRAIKAMNNKDIICVSKGLEKEITESQRISPQSIRCIYNPIDADTIRVLSDQNIPEDIFNKDTAKRYCIHIGRFAKQKRHDLLFKMMQINTSIHMLLLTRKSKKLVKMIKQFGLEERVTIKEFAQNPYPLIKQAQALILCSDYEGFGLVISEALACNTPVISTDCPHGPSEQLRGSLKKYLTPKNDPHALAITLRKSLENKNDFIDNDTIKTFSPRKIAQQYINLIHNNSK